MDQPLRSEYKRDLNHERSNILADIAERHSGLENDTTASLSQLKARYNTLMDRIDIIDKTSIGDPLKALPLELWEKIIHDAIGSHGSGFFHSDIDDLLLLTLVSTSWRQSILTNPRFWARIQILEQIEDLEAKITTCIELSGNLPLDLHVDVREPLWDVVCLTIVAQSSRIRTLVVVASNPFPAPQDAVSRLINVFKSFGKLSALEDLSVYGMVGPHIDIDFLLKDATSIRSLHGVTLSPQTLQLDSVRNIRYLDVYQSHYDILRHIRDFLHLKKVSFFNFPDTPEHDEAEFSDFDKGKDAFSLNQEPWQWETLSMAHHPGKLTFSLLDIVSTTLLDLTISISWDLLPRLLIACTHMSRLVSLFIRLPISTSASFQSPLLDGHKSNIEVFTLFIHQYSNLQHQSIDEAAKAACLNAAQGFANALIVWAPNVKDIYLHTEINPFFALPYMESLRHLNILVLSNLKANPDAMPEARLDGIESLHLRAENEVPDISSLSCPNIMKFSIDIFPPVKQPLILQPLGVHAERWVNLRTIDITTDDILWENISLPRVKSITVGSQTVSAMFPRHLSPSLLKELASNPSIFPSLNYLGMRCFPDWDVLFIMLERRNFSTFTEIKAVTKLSLPSFPSPMVLQPLFELLRRRMTDRPSNFDVSLQSLAEAYFDRELDGCGDCHMSFMPCTQHPMYHYPHDMDIGSGAFKLQVPPYPSTDNEVLSTCLQRANWWEDTVRNLGERGHSCARHDIYNMVEITDYTCSGLSEVLDLAPHGSPIITDS